MAVRNLGIDWQGDWASQVQRKLGIVTIADPSLVPDALMASRCSKTKQLGKDKATPREFYVSPLNLAFYRFCEAAHRRYGILSDLYGIHFDDEQLAFYDIHPSSLSNEKIAQLGQVIGDKCRRRKWSKVCFYNTSPIMSVPYFLMLQASGLQSYFFTQLPDMPGAPSFF